LIVISGVGPVQRWGGPTDEIRPGDVVWFSPGEKHWHGASPTTAMTHIAIQEKLDGKAVEWMEHVTDEQARRRRCSPHQGPHERRRRRFGARMRGVFDITLPLHQVADGYRAMDERRAIKTLLHLQGD